MEIKNIVSILLTTCLLWNSILDAIGMQACLSPQSDLADLANLADGSVQPLGPKLSNSSSDPDPMDWRPVKAKLLHELFVRLSMRIKAIVNPDNGPIRVLYGGAAADLSNFLLATNATVGYFVDQNYSFTEQELSLLADTQFLKNRYLKNLPEGYLEKYKLGYSKNVPKLRTKMGMIAALACELNALGVNLTTIHVSSDNVGPTLSFEWKYSGLSPMRRTIKFIQANMTDTDQLNSLLRKMGETKFQVYYQRASLGMPLAYEDFIPFVAKSMDPGGYCITDDYAFFTVNHVSGKEDSRLITNEANRFPGNSSKIKDPKKEELEFEIVRDLRRLPWHLTHSFQKLVDSIHLFFVRPLWINPPMDKDYYGFKQNVRRINLKTLSQPKGLAQEMWIPHHTPEQSLFWKMSFSAFNYMPLVLIYFWVVFTAFLAVLFWIKPFSAFEKTNLDFLSIVKLLSTVADVYFYIWFGLLIGKILSSAVFTMRREKKFFANVHLLLSQEKSLSAKKVAEKLNRSEEDTRRVLEILSSEEIQSFIPFSGISKWQTPDGVVYRFSPSGPSSPHSSVHSIAA